MLETDEQDPFENFSIFKVSPMEDVNFKMLDPQAHQPDTFSYVVYASIYYVIIKFKSC